MPKLPPRFPVVAGMLTLLLATLAILATRWETAQERLRANRQAYNVRVGSPVSGFINLVNLMTIPDDRFWSPWPAWVFRWTRALGREVGAVEVGLLVVGVGLCGIALRPVEPPTRAVRPGPGRITLVISTGAMVFGTLGAIQRIWGDPLFPKVAATLTPNSPVLFWPNVIGMTEDMVAGTIATAWITLAVSCQWRRAPVDTAERLGRWLGWAWIGLRFSLRFAEVVGMTTKPFP